MISRNHSLQHTSRDDGSVHPASIEAGYLAPALAATSQYSKNDVPAAEAPAPVLDPPVGRRDRRNRSRVGTEQRVVLALVFPNESFTPHIESTLAWNISESGLLATVTLPDYRLRKALKELHYCRVQFVGCPYPERVIGRIAWISHETGEGFTHRVGIVFQQLGPEESDQLANLIRLLRGDGCTPPERATA